MTNAEILQDERNKIRKVNATVVDKFKELKEALKDAYYVFDKADRMTNEDVNVYINLRNDLEKLFCKYSSLYTAIDKQTGHVGF